MAFSSSRGRAIVLTLAFGTLCGLDNLTLLASSLLALLLPYLLQPLASCSALNPPGLKTFAFVLLYANMPLPQIATGLSSNATFSTWLSVPTLVIAAQSSLTAVLPAPLCCQVPFIKATTATSCLGSSQSCLRIYIYVHTCVCVCMNVCVFFFLVKW